MNGHIPHYHMNVEMKERKCEVDVNVKNGELSGVKCSEFLYIGAWDV